MPEDDAMNDKQATADKQTMAVLLAEGFAFAVQVGLISGAAIVAALGKFLLALLLLGLAWGLVRRLRRRKARRMA
jgi:phage/plasmid primase-like uncharacterized protein